MSCDSDSSITGHSTLPSSCPVCEHAPLSADDCKPNKSLRTTIRVFIRTEEKKRESSRQKESAEPTPVTAVETTALTGHPPSASVKPPAEGAAGDTAASTGDAAGPTEQPGQGVADDKDNHATSAADTSRPPGEAANEVCG